MLTDIGATYCIIGHSERRGYFGETDEDINKKAKALMAHGIVPISCCGESLEVREAGKHVEFVVDQIRKDTEDVDGALVGGASLKADSFAAMVKAAM